MKQYHDMLKHVLENGEERDDRTGTGTIGVFGYQNRYDLSEGFPLVTTKKVPLRLIFEELKWFLNGDTNIKSLLDKNVHIWDGDAYRWYSNQVKHLDEYYQMDKEEYFQTVLADEQFAEVYGDLGDIYGKQWRSWSAYDPKEHFSDETDQIKNVIWSIKNDPFGRRHIVSAWNPGDLSFRNTALPPCHILFQFYVSTDGRLSCQLYQRSADAFLGVPFNIASYSLLVHMIARETGLQVGEFIHTFGDLHIYKNHIEQVKEQLSREPYPLPRVILDPSINNVDDFKWEHINLVDYKHHQPIKGKVSVGK